MRAQIVESSARAFHSTAWQKLSAAERGNLLLSLARVIEEHARNSLSLELLDTGKPIAQLRAAEIP